MRLRSTPIALLLATVGLAAVPARADVTGSGRIVDETRSVGDFTAISVAAGILSMSERMRGFQVARSFFTIPSAMTGLHVAPTAPSAMDWVSSSIDAESFHKQVGVVCVIW